MNIRRFFRTKRPEIILGAGLALIVLGTIQFVKGTPKAMECIEEKKEELDKEELTLTEKVAATWKVYLPAVVAQTAGITSVIFSNHLTNKRTAALGAAYQLTRSAFKEYKDSALEVVGKKKEEEIRSNAAQKRFNKEDFDESRVVVLEDPIHLCCDSASHQYFRSNKMILVNIESKMNERLRVEGTITLNDLYDEMGLETTDIGDELGWHYFGDGDDELIHFSFSTAMAKNDEPCIMVEYDCPPYYVNGDIYSQRRYH